MSSREELAWTLVTALAIIYAALLYALSQERPPAPPPPDPPSSPCLGLDDLRSYQ